MAKSKSFKNELNPALQFISIQNSEQMKNSENAKDYETLQHVEHLQNTKSIAKNSINNNNDKKIDGYKINHQYIETKSKRVQLLMQPSIYARVKMQADTDGLSVNEYIHSLLCAEFDRD